MKICLELQKLEASPSYQEHLKNASELEAIVEEKETAAMEQENLLWLEREEIAQKEWLQKKEEREEKIKAQELREVLE